MKKFIVAVSLILMAILTTACGATGTVWHEIPDRHISSLSIGNATMFALLPNGDLRVWGANVGFPRTHGQVVGMHHVVVGDDMPIRYIAVTGGGRFSHPNGYAMAIAWTCSKTSFVSEKSQRINAFFAS